jgi:hypothetical protein
VAVAVSPVAAVLQASTAVMETLAALVHPETIAQIRHQLVTVLVLLERTVGMVKQAQRTVIRDITTPIPVNLVSMHVQQGTIVHRMECQLPPGAPLDTTARILQCHLTIHAPLDPIALTAIHKPILIVRVVPTARILQCHHTIHAPLDPTAPILE